MAQAVAVKPSPVRTGWTRPLADALLLAAAAPLSLVLAHPDSWRSAWLRERLGDRDLSLACVHVRVRCQHRSMD